MFEIICKKMENMIIIKDEKIRFEKQDGYAHGKLRVDLGVVC